MFDKKDIYKFLFFDIETVSGEKDLDTLRLKNKKLAELWDKRTDYLRERYPDNLTKSNEEIYVSKGGLHSEYGKIVCITFGSLRSDNSLSIKSFYGNDENDILKKSLSLIEHFFEKVGTTFGKLVGHNLQRFDIPVLCKRAIIHGLEIPSILQLHNLKPWEYPLVDTANLWSHGAWQEGFASLELLCNILNIPSPKEELRADQVQSTYYDENNIEKIADYCEKDVEATANVILKFSNLDLVNDIKK